MTLNENNLNYYVVGLADTNNYSDSLQVIRIKHNNRYIDVHLGSHSYEIPNSNKHLVLLLCSEKFIESAGFTSDVSTIKPGYNPDGTIANLDLAVGFLIDKKQKISLANPQNASSTFAIENSSMSDPNNTRIAITPPIDADYTNTDDSISDRNSANIGIFINDKVIFIKSHGGQITLGDEGVHIGGQVFWESTTHEKDIMINNPLAPFIPPTLPTVGTANKELPNISKFTNIAAAIQNFVSITNKASKAVSLIG